MADDLTTAITDAVEEPQAATVEGESVTNRSIPDLIAGQKAINANSGIDAVKSSGWPFARSRMVPPSARGNY